MKIKEYINEIKQKTDIVEVYPQGFNTSFALDLNNRLAKLLTLWGESPMVNKITVDILANDYFNRANMLLEKYITTWVNIDKLTGTTQENDSNSENNSTSTNTGTSIDNQNIYPQGYTDDLEADLIKVNKNIQDNEQNAVQSTTTLNKGTSKAYNVDIVANRKKFYNIGLEIYELQDKFLYYIKGDKYSYGDE